MSLPFDLRTFYKITEIWQGGYSLKCCSFCYGLVYLVGKKFCSFIVIAFTSNVGQGSALCFGLQGSVFVRYT